MFKIFLVSIVVSTVYTKELDCLSKVETRLNRNQLLLKWLAEYAKENGDGTNRILEEIQKLPYTDSYGNLTDILESSIQIFNRRPVFDKALVDLFNTGYNFWININNNIRNLLTGILGQFETMASNGASAVANQRTTILSTTVVTSPTPAWSGEILPGPFDGNKIASSKKKVQTDSNSKVVTGNTLVKNILKDSIKSVESFGTMMWLIHQTLNVDR